VSDYTPEQIDRWNAWAHANALAMERSDHLARLVGVLMLTTAMLVTVIVAFWR
jgi:hypothetical protein